MFLCILVPDTDVALESEINGALEGTRSEIKHPTGAGDVGCEGSNIIVPG